MGANISPKDAGMILDRSVPDDHECILKGVLMAVFDITDVECEMWTRELVVEIDTESEVLKDAIVRYVLSIPTLNDEGKYTSVDFAFDSCVLITAKRVLYKRDET